MSVHWMDMYSTDCTLREWGSEHPCPKFPTAECHPLSHPCSHAELPTCPICGETLPSGFIVPDPRTED